ncbi:MAG TPA: hypothetical protein VKU00_25490 [Chthonomonadaceae bacterium]|nr:hypothetical protein [Chthonomonadaceae bacterium]
MQREATLIWAPLYDRAVALFLETLEGPAPMIKVGPRSKPLRDATGKFFVEGGWPCQHYPEDWQARVQSLLEDYQRLRKEHALCGKPERQGENFALLRGYLAVCLQNPQQLTGRDVGRIRLALAQSIARRGLPASERCRSLRQYQADLANRPTRADMARVVIERLATLPAEDGLETLDEALAPVTAEEAEREHLEAGLTLAGPLEGKVRRCLQAPVEVLVEQEIISSGEVLARVIPQITSQVAAVGITDPDLRRLYAALYEAFRRRRSLLLLHLESQVKFVELPWVKAMDVAREHDSSAQDLARQTLEQVVVLAITAFPQQILPNKLLQEIRALAQSAALALPLVDEVAADIFMGAFSEKFLRAAQVAGKLLEGTLYERYYEIAYAQVQQIDDVRPSPYGGAPTSPAFYQICSERAGRARGRSWVARNGMVIEQEQILTTHNLAVLFVALGLSERLRSDLDTLAQRCFAWICRRHLQMPPNGKARLQLVKNTAYAWRQMLFFLALESEGTAEAFLAWASDYLSQQPTAFQARFQPAMEGLARALQGLPPETRTWFGRTNRPRRFLGWTTETHWLLA